MTRLRFLLAWGRYPKGAIITPGGALRDQYLAMRWYGRRVVEVVQESEPVTAVPVTVPVPPVVVESKPEPNTAAELSAEAKQRMEKGVRWMINAQKSKVVSLLSPQSVTTSATVSATVSCVGFSYAEITLHMATQTAANVDTTMTVTEGDSSTFATHADLLMTTVAPDTSSPQIYKWFLDLRKRKKNLKITYQPVGAARVVAANIVLSRPEAAPVSAAGHGVTAQVIA